MLTTGMGAAFLVNAPVAFKLRWVLTSPRRDPRLKKVAQFVDVSVDQVGSGLWVRKCVFTLVRALRACVRARHPTPSTLRD